MKPMILAFAVMGVISAGAYYALGNFGFSSADQTSGTAVRLD